MKPLRQYGSCSFSVPFNKSCSPAAFSVGRLDNYAGIWVFGPSLSLSFSSRPPADSTPPLSTKFGPTLRLAGEHKIFLCLTWIGERVSGSTTRVPSSPFHLILAVMVPRYSVPCSVLPRPLFLVPKAMDGPTRSLLLL